MQWESEELSRPFSIKMVWILGKVRKEMETRVQTMKIFCLYIERGFKMDKCVMPIKSKEEKGQQMKK